MAIPDPLKLLEIAEIKSPLIGFYDISDPEPFKPFSKSGRCIFSAYENWLRGESQFISEGNCTCQGGGYWMGGIVPSWVTRSPEKGLSAREIFAKSLNQREGFKSSDDLMYQWLENLRPYIIKNGYIVVGPLKSEHYEHLKTVTFFVNPDQLSLLLIGAEYNNASIGSCPVKAPFGSGCGQIAALFNNLDSDIPEAVIGATDIAMREHLPPEILAFSVNKAMFEQLCKLDENSFLYKSFWKRLKNARKI